MTGSRIGLKPWEMPYVAFDGGNDVGGQGGWDCEFFISPEKQFEPGPFNQFCRA
jgi:hypothetical protein